MYKNRLLTAGIPADIKGFYFLNRAIEIYEPAQPIMNLYIDIAKEFDTTPSRVERAMRHAITHTGEKDSNDKFVSNGQFVANNKIRWAAEKN